MANVALSLLGLDFSTIKASLTAYLQSQDRFRGFNFSGSNWDVVLDALSYNARQQYFYINMAGSEMFLDSAQLTDSIASHGKELNYCPRSNISSVIYTNITINTGNVFSVVIPPHTTFTGRVGANVYTFSTNDTISALSSSPFVTLANVALYEGIIVSETFTKDSSNVYQRFILSNPGVDITSISLQSVENSGANTLTYQPATSLFGLNANSQVFFVQASGNSKYEVIFGDNVVGRTPADGSSLIATYRISNGDLPNGLFQISPNDLIGGFDNVSLTVLAPASGGAFRESDASVKFNAPRAFTTQERAVTDTDYETLLRLNFPEIRAVAAFGGDELSPPVYGKVYVSVLINGVDGIPTSKKNQYTNFLNTRSPLTILPIIISPTFLYVDVNTIVNYNVNLTQNSNETILSKVANSINTFNDTYLDDFKTTLYYSKFCAAIDNADISIVSNETNLRLISIISPFAGIAQNFYVTFNQPLTDNLPPLDITHTASDQHTVISSPFLVDNKTVILEDDGNGNINLSQTTLAVHKVIKKVGTINYATGVITISNITPSTGSLINIYAITQNKDFVGKQNTILAVRDQDVTISVNQVRL